MARRLNTSRANRSSGDAGLRSGGSSGLSSRSSGSGTNRASRPVDSFARRATRPNTSRQQAASKQSLSSFASSSSQSSRLATPFVASPNSNRAFWPIVLFALLAVVFFGRLFILQVVMADEYRAQAEETRTISFDTAARRGTIYDRNGTVLATNVDATTIYVNPAEVTDAADSAAKIAAILGGDVADYQEKLSRNSATFVYLVRQADVAAADQVKALGLPGVYFVPDSRREYPCGQIAAQIIGLCDVDGKGVSGLEMQYDDILSGLPGSYSAERGRDGIPIPGGVQKETVAVDGQDIMVSLDVELQEYLETRLASGVKDINAQGGSAVVMDAGTGEIYAAASLPYLDPNNVTVGEGADQLKVATQAFEPGSVFKTVSTMTLLETGSMAPDDTLFCPAVIEADGYRVSDAHKRDDATFSLRQILDQSSNVGISLATESMGFDQLYQHILTYNLNERTGVDYPGEASGTLQSFENWSRITGYNVSFGQGISMTPLQVTRFYGSLVNDGVEVTPHFLISMPQSDETPTYATEDVIANKAAIPVMVDMLKTVVTNGTGTAAQIDGFSVAGKTSTAEIAEGGTYKPGVYNLCFTGFLPDSSSQLVCFVGANEVPTQGSVANIFKDIMTCAIDRFKISPK